MTSAQSAAYNEGLGAEPLVGRQRGKAPPLKLKHFGERSMEAANSPIFLKFGNAENHRYLRCFSK